MKRLETKKIGALKKYFKKEPSMILAFLFGSFTKGFQMKESDFDVAVYLKNYSPTPGPLCELKKPERIRNIERKIWFDLTQLIQKEIDLVCLNEAPASLISNIFKTGVPLKIEDKKLYWELYLSKSLESEDFLNFVEDFREIKKKTKSLIPGQKERLEIRFDYLNDEMKKLERFKKLKLDDYLTNWDERKIVERWTESIINALIDIAKIVLASEKKEIPKSYGDALFYFGFMLSLGEEDSEKLSEFAALRNIMAHEYLEILYGRIQNFIKEFPRFYKKISNFLEKYLKKK